MKTAMQELIDIIVKVEGNNLNKEYLLNTINVFIEKEKYQIIDAVNNGTFIKGKRYYDSTFGDNHEAGI